MLICTHNFVNFYSCLNVGIVGIPLIDLVTVYVLCSQRQSRENLPFCLLILMEGGVLRGVPIPQNCTEICVNTAQNNITKPETALKLPENF